MKVWDSVLEKFLISVLLKAIDKKDETVYFGDIEEGSISEWLAEEGLFAPSLCPISCRKPLVFESDRVGMFSKTISEDGKPRNGRLRLL